MRFFFLDRHCILPSESNITALCLSSLYTSKTVPECGYSKQRTWLINKHCRDFVCWQIATSQIWKFIQLSLFSLHLQMRSFVVAPCSPCSQAVFCCWKIWFAVQKPLNPPTYLQTVCPAQVHSSSNVDCRYIFKEKIYQHCNNCYPQFSIYVICKYCKSAALLSLGLVYCLIPTNIPFLKNKGH